MLILMGWPDMFWTSDVGICPVKIETQMMRRKETVRGPDMIHEGTLKGKGPLLFG